jgi:hypothetical protein
MAKGDRRVNTFDVHLEVEDNPDVLRIVEYMNKYGYEWCANKVQHGMEESDWVVLRLCAFRYDCEADKAWEYLCEKYGEAVVNNCVLMIQE